MAGRNWKGFRPSGLAEAFEGCSQFAMEKHRRDPQRIADLMGLPSRWAFYKWLANGSMPARLIPMFEHVCGAHFVTAHFAASAHRLLIDFPTGRVPSADDVHALQHACNTAVGAVIAFARGESTTDETLAAIRVAMELLAHEHANVTRHQQPGLDLP